MVRIFCFIGRILRNSKFCIIGREGLALDPTLLAVFRRYARPGKIAQLPVEVGRKAHFLGSC